MLATEFHHRAANMNLSAYRASAAEKQRTDDLVRLFPKTGQLALDIGARDGHFSLLLAECFASVIALDLSQPEVDHPRVQCITGNAAHLQFDSRCVDFVFCAEVLEHIPSDILAVVCREIERVSNDKVLIGVPYRQDIRVGRTTCGSCRKINPPWGHVNRFDESRIAALFPACDIDAISFVGTTTEQTNAISTKLMDLAGNPYGTYQQEEPCIHCGSVLQLPPSRNLVQKLATKAAFWSRSISTISAQPRGKWMHVLLSKRADVSAHKPSPQPS